MEKQTDSSTSATTSNSNSGGSTTTVACNNNMAAASDEANHNEEISQKQHRIHNHQNNLTSSATKNQTENQPNNSLGCGPSSTTTIAATSSSMVIGSSSSNVGGNSNLSTNKVISSLNNNATVCHQTTNTTTNAASVLSNIASSVSVTTTSSSTISASTLSSAQMAPINLNISTTTGGNFSVSVDPQTTVENLKKIISKKLKVAKDRICLLHREKKLQDGSLKDNNLMDGARVILIPNVETGLLAQRPENTVMQALESLNDAQVNDFLSGKTPLNLSMRLGDHMMLIQLQLSTVHPVVHHGPHCSSHCSRQRSSHHHHHRSSRTSTTATAATQTSGTTTSSNYSHHHHHHHHHHHNSNTATVSGSAATVSGSTTTNPTAVSVATAAQNVTAIRNFELETACQTPRNNTNNTSALIAPHASRASTSIVNSSSSSVSASSIATKNSDLSSFLSKRDYESLQNIVKSITMAQPPRLVQRPISTSNTTNSAVQTTSIVLPNPGAVASVPVVAAPSFHASSEAVLLEQSPIKSLSNLVSSPIKTTAIKNIPKMSNTTNSSSTSNNVALGPHTVPISGVSAVAAATSNTSVAAANTAMCQDPIAAKLTSCLCTRLNSSSLGPINSAPHNSAKQCIETACVSQQQIQSASHLHHHHHRQQQLQTHAARSTSSIIVTNTPNCKQSPSSIITALSGGSTNCSSTSPSKSSSSMHKTANNPIARKHRHHHHHHHHHHHYHQITGVQQQVNAPNTPKVATNNNATANKVLANNSEDSLLAAAPTKPLASSSCPANSSPNQTPANRVNVTPVVAAAAAPSTTSNTTATNVTSTASPASEATPIELDDSSIVSDSRTLAEASRNLTQTLRKLSKEVFTNKIDFSASDDNLRKSGSGAVIESMKNHGKGIYSGTFSGTLNPALQDRYGRPKRDISTIIHILNDLLSATPQYHRGARISFDAPSTSAAAAASVAAAGDSTGTIHHSSRNKHHFSSKHHQCCHHCVKCAKPQSSSSSTANNLATASTSSATSSTNASSVCTYGECSGHYASSKAHSAKTYTCCQPDLSANSTSLAASSSAGAQQPQAGQNNGGLSQTSSNHHHHGSSHHHHHHHHHHQTVDERKVCQCRYRIHAETGERERDFTCLKCASEMDNIKTKSKLDQLRLVMQQRKQKREARKLKGAPYGARVVGTTTPAATNGVTDNAAATLTATNSSLGTPISVAAASTTPSEVSPNHLVEEVDTAA